MKKLSVITPLYNTPKNYLDDVLQSVSPYADSVELVLVNDSPGNLRLTKRLRQLESEDIKVVYNERNYGIFAAYCNGFRIASAEYCCILDHDDIFDPSQVLPELDKKPDLLYTDEYKFFDDENGRKIKDQPYKKPEFDVLSAAFYFYTHHVTVLRTNIIQQRLNAYEHGERYTSVFDIHMILEYMAAFAGKEMKVIHLHTAAYGWRVHANSTAYRLDQKLSGYFERVRKTDEFFRYFGEEPLLRIDEKTGYLVDGEFLSAYDAIRYPMEAKEFRKRLKREKKLVGPSMTLELLKGEYTEEDYQYFLEMLSRLPVRYLQQQNCLPLLIRPLAELAGNDLKNSQKHVWNVPFLCQVKDKSTGLLLRETSQNTQRAKYAVFYMQFKG